MQDELINILRAYLDNRAGRDALRLFLAEFDWDDPSTEAIALQPVIGRLDLITEEVGEGLRDDAELRSYGELILDRLEPTASISA